MRVKELLGKDTVVALDFSVVARCVWRDALMAGAVKYFGEVVRPVASSVVGDDSVDVVNSVRGEPRSRPVYEADGCCGPFIA